VDKVTAENLTDEQLHAELQRMQAVEDRTVGEANLMRDLDIALNGGAKPDTIQRSRARAERAINARRGGGGR
jgi:hypothetical protein